MADVMAVADRVVVLRLGRNNGVYNVAELTSETLIAAITGASDSAALRRSTDRPSPSSTAETLGGPETDADTGGGRIIRMPSGGARRPSTRPKDGGR